MEICNGYMISKIKKIKNEIIVDYKSIQYIIHNGDKYIHNTMINRFVKISDGTILDKITNIIPNAILNEKDKNIAQIINAKKIQDGVLHYNNKIVQMPGYSIIGTYKYKSRNYIALGSKTDVCIKKACNGYSVRSLNRDNIIKEIKIKIDHASIESLEKMLSIIQ